MYVFAGVAEFVVKLDVCVVFFYNLHLTSVNDDDMTLQFTPSTYTLISCKSNENPVPLINKSCPLIDPLCVV